MDSAPQLRIASALHKIANQLERFINQRQQEIEAIRTAKEREERERNIQPVWVEPILAAYQQAEANRTANDNRQHRVQNSLRWATWLAFGAATVYAAVAVVQWQDLKSNFTVDERAYVVQDGLIDHTPLPPVAGQPTSMALTFKNVGRTIAKQVVMLYTAERITAIREDPDQIQTVNRIFQHVGQNTRTAAIDMAPGGLSNTVADRATVPAFTPEEVAQFTRREIGIVFTGSATYWDIFGKMHTTEFCYLATGQNFAVIPHCFVHNSIQ